MPNFFLPSRFGIQYISPNTIETVNNIAKIQEITNEFIYCRCRFLLCGITADAMASAGINCCSTVSQHKCI